MKVGDSVKCIWSMRKSKAYAKYGATAVAGDTGPVVAIHELKDVMIVVVQSQRGPVHAHIQNLM